MIDRTRRPRFRWLRGAAALAAGALCAGVFQELSAAPPSPLARDEEFLLRFNGATPVRRVLGGITVTAPAGSGLDNPQGMLLAGRGLIDAGAQRAVVVRPEAMREYFMLVEGQDRDAADAKSARLLERVERTGNVKLLRKIDAALDFLGPLVGGTRLDFQATFAFYPPRLPALDPAAPYRTLVAGDDALWEDHMVNGNFTAFATLQTNDGYERFHHRVDPQSGIRDQDSVLRRRVHRRVLMRRARGILTFVPDIPVRPDLTDAGYAAGATYDVELSPAFRGIVKALQPARGGTVRFAGSRVSFSTAPDTGDGGLFLGGRPWAGAPSADPPRVVNITPPDGEEFIDPTTDWEDPDNRFVVPIPARHPFVIRLRFAQPLDPRTVDAAHFTLTKTAQNPGTPQEIRMDVPVVVAVVLTQQRMGEILVTLRPFTNLDPSAQYEVKVSQDVRSLDGIPLGNAFIASCRVH